MRSNPRSPKTTLGAHLFVHNTISCTNNYYMRIFIHSTRPVVMVGKAMAKFSMLKCESTRSSDSIERFLDNLLDLEIVGVQQRTNICEWLCFVYFQSPADRNHHRALIPFKSISSAMEIQLISEIRCDECTSGMHKQINQMNNCVLVRLAFGVCSLSRAFERINNDFVWKAWAELAETNLKDFDSQ